MNDVDLTGRAAIVTGGAGSGCGSAISAALAKAGASVAIVDKDESRVFAVAEALAAEHGGLVKGYHINITDYDGIERTVAEIADQMGPVSILVNNAAINKPMPFYAYEPAFFARIVETDFVAAWNMVRLVYDDMKASGGGSIINISSVAPYTNGGVVELPYSASKAAMHDLTRAVAVEGGPHDIRSNALLLGVVRTAFVEKYWDELDLGSVVEKSPLKRLVELSEVTAAMLFLLSPGGTSITGEMLNISGGDYLTY
jgi:3-oxoacyl-[acyl-carrier protein] reductase